MSSVSSSRSSSPSPSAVAGFGTNEWLVEEMYQQYVADPSSVDQAWHEFFADYRPGSPVTGGGRDGATGNGQAAAATTAAPAATPAPEQQQQKAPATSAPAPAPAPAPQAEEKAPAPAPAAQAPETKAPESKAAESKLLKDLEKAGRKAQLSVGDMVSIPKLGEAQVKHVDSDKVTAVFPDGEEKIFKKDFVKKKR